jgi:hypothetical protein
LAAHNPLTENFSLNIASKYEFLSNMNIIYWNSGLNAGGSRIFYSYNTQSTSND